MADGKRGSHVAFEDDVAFEGGASPRVGGLAEPARVEHEWRHAEYCCVHVPWGHHRIRVSAQGVQLQRARGPCGVALCTQQNNLGIPHAKIGRFRTTWSNASALMPLLFLFEGLLLGLLYAMITNDALSKDSIRVAGCDWTDVEAYAECASGVEIDVGSVKTEHVTGEHGPVVLAISLGWFLLRLVIWLCSRVSKLELSGDGCPEEDSWVFFPNGAGDRQDLQRALMDEQYRHMQYDGTSDDDRGLTETWEHKGEELTFARHHLKTTITSGCGLPCGCMEKGTVEVMATYEAARWLHLARAGRTCRALVLYVVVIGVVLGAATFIFVDASGVTAGSSVNIGSHTWSVLSLLTLAGLILGGVLGMLSWIYKASSFAEFGIDHDTCSGSEKVLAAAGLLDQTIRVAIPKQNNDEIKATYLARQLQRAPSWRKLKQFRGQTGDNMSLSMLTLYEDRVELDLKTYCHFSCFKMCRSCCRFCEKEESYIVLLRDIEYVKTGYVGSPLLYWGGLAFLLAGWVVMGAAPIVIAKMASTALPTQALGDVPLGGDALEELDRTRQRLAATLNSYSDQQVGLWIQLTVCQGLAMLLWIWYLWRKRSVIHLGVRPGGGEHGKINPSAPPPPSSSCDDHHRYCRCCHHHRRWIGTAPPPPSSFFSRRWRLRRMTRC